MAMITGKELDVLAVRVTDLARSEAFCRDQLGFEKPEDMAPGILMKAGEVTLYLEAGREDAGGGHSVTRNRLRPGPDAPLAQGALRRSHGHGVAEAVPRYDLGARLRALVCEKHNIYVLK